jgi:hypothetical protein
MFFGGCGQLNATDRYSVDLEILSVRQMSVAGMVLSACIFSAV